MGHVPAAFDGSIKVASAMQEERGHTDERQDVSDIDLGVHARERHRRARARAPTQVGHPPMSEPLVGRDARS